MNLVAQAERGAATDGGAQGCGRFRIRTFADWRRLRKQKLPPTSNSLTLTLLTMRCEFPTLYPRWPRRLQPGSSPASSGLR